MRIPGPYNFIYTFTSVLNEEGVTSLFQFSWRTYSVLNVKILLIKRNNSQYMSCLNILFEEI